jgi:hypothetical protein
MNARNEFRLSVLGVCNEVFLDAAMIGLIGKGLSTETVSAAGAEGVGFASSLVATSDPGSGVVCILGVTLSYGVEFKSADEVLGVLSTASNPMSADSLTGAVAVAALGFVASMNARRPLEGFRSRTMGMLDAGTFFMNSLSELLLEPVSGEETLVPISALEDGVAGVCVAEYGSTEPPPTAVTPTSSPSSSRPFIGS